MSELMDLFVYIFQSCEQAKQWKPVCGNVAGLLLPIARRSYSVNIG